MLQFPSDDGFAKIIYQESNDYLLEACAGMMTRYLGNDGGVKSAASEVFSRAKLAEYAPPKGKFMLHAVAMGSEEAYGANKNGDAFSKRALEESHPTFVRDGYMFREHLNHDPDLQIGQIKASAWHPGLQRVELILWGDCEKAAKEYEAVRAGKPLSFSMSCKVAHDVCSCCENRAKSAAVYCGHLRNHMGQWIPEFHKYAYAQNPDPRFFDMSAVERPADRIAHLLQSRVDGLEKAASTNRVISGAELAILEGLVLPGRFSQATPFSRDRMARLEKLAALEAQMEVWTKDHTTKPHLKQAFARDVAVAAFYPDRHLDLHAVEARPGTIFRALAKRACLLSPQSLWSYVQGEPHTKLADEKEVLRRLPTLFRDLHKRAMADGGIGNISHCCDMDSAMNSELDQGYDSTIDGLMAKADELFGLGDQMSPRTLQISIVKGASVIPAPAADEATPEVQGLMDLYGVYKLAAVDHIAELHPDLNDEMLSMLAIGQNFQLAMS